MKRFIAIGWAVLVMALGVMPGELIANERKLDAAEIARALAGNTVEGNWKGTAFKQFFAKNGATTYVAEGSPPSEGKWKADRTKNQYCSWWEGSGWDCYDIYSTGPESIIWVVPDGSYRSPSTLIPGKQL